MKSLIKTVEEQSHNHYSHKRECCFPYFISREIRLGFHYLKVILGFQPISILESIVLDQLFKIAFLVECFWINVCMCGCV